MSVWVWAAVAGVGGLGATLRFLIDGAIGRRARSARISIGRAQA